MKIGLCDAKDFARSFFHDWRRSCVNNDANREQNYNMAGILHKPAPRCRNRSVEHSIIREFFKAKNLRKSSPLVSCYFDDNTNGLKVVSHKHRLQIVQNHR